jgi:DNA-binding XRE family transcriptional regulator
MPHRLLSWCSTVAAYQSLVPSSSGRRDTLFDAPRLGVNAIEVALNRLGPAMQDDTTTPFAITVMDCEGVSIGSDTGPLASAKFRGAEAATLLAYQLRLGFGQRLRQSRINESLTRIEVATLAGLSEEFVEQIEHGLRDPTLQEMAVLALAVDRELWDLLALPDA